MGRAGGGLDQLRKPHGKRYALAHLCGGPGGGRLALFLQSAEKDLKVSRQKLLPERGILAGASKLSFGDR